jgi:hypothetical protein
MCWLRNCTRTFNLQWERDHQQPQAPFPYRPFVDRKIDLDALPFPPRLHRGRSFQSEDDLKAMGNIKYANALYTNQPQWMKQMHPLASGEESTSHKVEWATGSLIRALPSGIRKFASSHAHGYMSDETAHQAGAEATINIVKP